MHIIKYHCASQVTCVQSVDVARREGLTTSCDMLNNRTSLFSTQAMHCRDDLSHELSVRRDEALLLCSTVWHRKTLTDERPNSQQRPGIGMTIENTTKGRFGPQTTSVNQNPGGGRSSRNAIECSTFGQATCYYLARSRASS